MMRLGVHYGSPTDFPSIIDDVVAFEEAGADLVWLGESYGFDAVSALGALSARTSKIGLGTAVLPVQTRSTALIAMSMLGLDALSGGRAVLGLGTSGPQVIEGLHDMAFGPPLSRIRAVIDGCRALWRGERLASGRTQPEGTPYKALKLMHTARQPEIPIFVAAIGPRTVSLAAEMADGWMPAFFWPDRFHDVWGDPLEVGRAKRSEQLGPLELSVSAPLAIGEGAAVQLAHYRGLVAHYLGGMGTRDVNFYLELAGRYGFGPEATRVQSLYMQGKKREAADAVPHELVEGTCLIGSETEVWSRLQAYVRAGVTVLNVVPAGETLHERLAHFRGARSLIGQIEPRTGC